VNLVAKNLSHQSKTQFSKMHKLYFTLSIALFSFFINTNLYAQTTYKQRKEPRTQSNNTASDVGKVLTALSMALETQMLVGKWQTSNCIFTLNQDNTIFIEWTGQNIVTTGTWLVSDNKLYVKNSQGGRIVYEFIKKSENYIKYYEVKSGSVYEATKIN
jgi:hypothetical protein